MSLVIIFKVYRRKWLATHELMQSAYTIDIKRYKLILSDLNIYLHDMGRSLTAIRRWLKQITFVLYVLI